MEVEARATNDEELVRAVRRGDVDSLGVLVARWERPLYRFAYRLLERREDARDVCQETFLRVWKKSDRFREGARFSTWMYQIALNLCRDQLRRRKRWGTLVKESDLSDATTVASDVPAVTPGDELQASERKRAVVDALQALPPEQREVLVLKEYEGLKFREIAEILHCPESTVKSRMYYGLSSLKTILSRQGFGEEG